VKRNPVKAREWFEKGAALGDPVDTYNLGLMIWNGEGGQRPDHPQAMALLRVAAAKGESRAKQAVAAGRPQ
jgi:TPR repeat protein